MTRFARTGQRNNKKVLDASQWTEMKSEHQQEPEHRDTQSAAPKDETSKTNRDFESSKGEGTSPLKKVKATTQFKSNKKQAQGQGFGKKAFSSNRPLDYSSLECYNCKQKGHKASDCPQPADGKRLEFECYNCKEMGHKSFQCPKQNNERNFGQNKQGRGGGKFSQHKTDGKGFKKFDKSDQNWKDARSEMRRVQRQTDVQNKRLCFNCREGGHQISDCPELKKDVEHGTGICFKCGSTEHSIHGCHVKLPSGEFPFAKCFICGETGHLSRQCPDNPRGLYPNGGCCRECGSVEHLCRDCPDFQKQQGIESITLGRLGADVSSMDAEEAQPEQEQEPSVKKKTAKPKPTAKKIVKF